MNHNETRVRMLQTS